MVASCEVVLLDASVVVDARLPHEIVVAGGAPVGSAMAAAPLLPGARDLLERSRDLGVVLGEGVVRPSRCGGRAPAAPCCR